MGGQRINLLKFELIEIVDFNFFKFFFIIGSFSRVTVMNRHMLIYVLRYNKVKQTFIIVLRRKMSIVSNDCPGTAFHSICRH